MEDIAERRERNKVADRFHLVRNLTKAVQQELEHRRHHLLIPATEFIRKDASENPGLSPQRSGGPNLRQKEIRRQRRQQKVELFRMVKGLQAQGMRAFEVVKATGISRGRVDKWLRLMECPPQNKMAPQPDMAEAFREELRRLWEHLHAGSVANKKPEIVRLQELKTEHNGFPANTLCGPRDTKQSG